MSNSLIISAQLYTCNTFEKSAKSKHLFIKILILKIVFLSASVFVFAFSHREICDGEVDQEQRHLAAVPALDPLLRHHRHHHCHPRHRDHHLHHPHEGDGVGGEPHHEHDGVGQDCEGVSLPELHVLGQGEVLLHHHHSFKNSLIR